MFGDVYFRDVSGSLWSAGWSELRAEIASLKSQVSDDFNIAPALRLWVSSLAHEVGKVRCNGDGDARTMKGSRSFQRVFTTLVQELFENKSLLKICDQCFLSFSCSILFPSLVIFGLVSIQVFPCVPHIPRSLAHIRLTFWRFAFSSKSGHAFASAETCDFEGICQRPRKRSPLFILFMSCSFDIYIFCFMLFPMCILFGQVYIRASTMNN